MVEKSLSRRYLSELLQLYSCVDRAAPQYTFHLDPDPVHLDPDLDLDPASGPVEVNLLLDIQAGA